ncbi:MAG: sugar phosphate isomerase/epimerase family protein [bacterium]|nr:sugar phosphate isomerase/epimerase family protein [bacterium]
MKYSIFTVGMPEYTPEEAVKKIKANGYDGVEWRVTAIPTDPAILAEKPSYWRNNLCTYDIETIDKKAADIKALCDANGLEINALATYLNASSDPKVIERCMKAAVTMNCPKIRVNCLQYDAKVGYNELFKQAVAGYEVIEKLGKEYGIKANMEMHHGTIACSASAAYRIASNFDSRYIGVIYDTGNVIYEGFEQYQMAFEILGEYLDHVHVKNAHWVKKEVEGVQKYVGDWATFTDGYADFPAIFKALKKVGYDNYVTFEDFSSEPTDEKLKTNIAYIKKIAAEV